MGPMDIRVGLVRMMQHIGEQDVWLMFAIHIEWKVGLQWHVTFMTMYFVASWELPFVRCSLRLQLRNVCYGLVRSIWWKTMEYKISILGASWQIAHMPISLAFEGCSVLGTQKKPRGVHCTKHVRTRIRECTEGVLIWTLPYYVYIQ